jgi:hypothetical protein
VVEPEVVVEGDVVGVGLGLVRGDLAVDGAGDHLVEGHGEAGRLVAVPSDHVCSDLSGDFGLLELLVENGGFIRELLTVRWVFSANI